MKTLIQNTFKTITITLIAAAVLYAVVSQIINGGNFAL